MSHAVRLAALILVALVGTGCTTDKPARLALKQRNEAEAKFYAEQVYEGRLYVFGTSRLYSEFQETHEMPFCLTFIGAGPNGQTLRIQADPENIALEQRLRKAYEERHGEIKG